MVRIIQLLEWAIYLPPLHHQKAGWSYLRNEKIYQRSAGGKMTVSSMVMTKTILTLVGVGRRPLNI